MAEQLYFSRDTKCYIQFDGVVWEMPILDGFSFSQSNSTSEITLAEMEDANGSSRRGRRAFNDALDPGEWSFSTYVRPFTSAGTGTGNYAAAEVHAVEEVLWAMFSGATDYDPTSDHYSRGATPANDVIVPGSTTTISFSQSNKTTLGTAQIYFVLGDANRSVMKLKDAIVNEASIDFDIDGIATISWSGLCSEVIDFTGSTVESNAVPTDSSATQDGSGTVAVGDIWLDSDDGFRLYEITAINTGADCSVTSYRKEDVNETDNFIRNRLSQLVIALDAGQRDPDSDSTNELQATYALTLTGGSISLSNNATYITPEELGKVNTPFAHVTGGRAFGGSFTCYLTLDTATLDSTKSRDLFDDLRAASNVVTNSFDLTFKIGGATGTRLEMNFPEAHLEIPTHSIEDVISLETNFMALPSTISGTDELNMTYAV
jgi:hypothetical protein